MRTRKTDWKKLAATNRATFERGERLWAQVAKEKDERTQRPDSPTPRKFKVRVKPKFLDEQELAERWGVHERFVRRLRKEGKAPPATCNDGGISYRLRDVRVYEKTSNFMPQVRTSTIS
jgi:hypothetical protein